VLLNATFIAGDEVFYAVGVRYRGESSRLVTPKSYRLDFADDEEFEGIKHLNLNGNMPQHQHLGMRVFRGAGVPAALTRVVRLAFGTDADRSYTRMEEMDEDFCSRFYAQPTGEDEGTSIAGSTTGTSTTAARTRRATVRATRGDERGGGRLVRPDRPLRQADEHAVANLPSVLPTVIDVDEWIRFFAAHTVISTQEGCIYRDKGDDYYLYRRPSDGLFVLIPWDIDDSFRAPTERLFRPSLPQIKKILEHPDYSPRYYSHLVRLASHHFSGERMSDEIALLQGLFSQSVLDTDFLFIQNRLSFVDSNTNQQFRVDILSETLVAGATSGATSRAPRSRREAPRLDGDRLRRQLLALGAHGDRVRRQRRRDGARRHAERVHDGLRTPLLQRRGTRRGTSRSSWRWTTTTGSSPSSRRRDRPVQRRRGGHLPLVQLHRERPAGAALPRPSRS